MVTAMLVLAVGCLMSCLRVGTVHLFGEASTWLIRSDSKEELGSVGLKVCRLTSYCTIVSSYAPHDES